MIMTTLILTTAYLNGQIIASMFSSAKYSEGWDRKDQVCFASKVCNMLIEWNLKILCLRIFVQDSTNTHKKMGENNNK